MKLTLCVDRQPRNNPSSEIREYSINIGCPLRSCEDVYDELKIITDDDKKLVGSIVRRCEVDKYGVLKKLENEKIQELALSEITLFEGDNYVYIKEFTDLNMKIQYLTNAEMNKFFATKMELNSTIQQTMDSILLEVSKKADNDQVSAMIQLLADKIALKVSSGDVVNALNISTQLIEIVGNRLKIDTDNFKLDEKGNMTATGANFVNGDISTNKNIVVGDNLFIGQNQAPNYQNHKYLYFDSSSYLQRVTYDSGTYLKMFSTLNTRLECQNTGYINVMSDNISMSHSPSTDSDKRLKKNISDVDVSWINFLKVKKFNYKSSPKTESIGLIAQDYLDEDYAKYFLHKNEDGYYSINYGNITNALIQYCQDLNKRISELERRCNNE